MEIVRDTILHGDVYACLCQLETGSVAVAATSPPYWKQRIYGFKGEIGQEPTPEEYIGRLVKIFDKLKEKMRDDGVFFLNVGDKYLSRYGKANLLQIPYRLAYHMTKHGWILEEVLCWFKVNFMPFPGRDRFANTFEPVFVFAKGQKNIYRKGLGTVLKVPLQQTSWKHTAVYPEKLIDELFSRVQFRDGDLVADVFAGTGTTAVCAQKVKTSLSPKNVCSVLIDKGDDFVEIMKKRTGITNVVKVEDVTFEWNPVVEESLPDGIPKVRLTDKHGEVFIAEDSREFLAAIKGLATEEFKRFHREDATYFFGVKNWSLSDLYFSSRLFSIGYILRNMLVASHGKTWFPIFMFARDSKKVAYKFNLDRIRVKAKPQPLRNWWKEEFVGFKVADLLEKKKGRVIKILARYGDGFPKIAVVKWNGGVSIEFVLHPEKDELLMEGVEFLCKACGKPLNEPYDPIGKNVCSNCKEPVWQSLENVPVAKEPDEVAEVLKELEQIDYQLGQVVQAERFQTKGVGTSKFAELDRVNWGASPGARKLMLGEYFTKTRVYRIDQPSIAHYLTLLRKASGLSVKEVIESLPKNYHHTVGHWFRTDFGGSTPVPEDLTLLMNILSAKNGLLALLKRTALKFQTVKAAIKGRNPGDFIETTEDNQLEAYLRNLYIPSSEYRKVIEKKAKQTQLF